MEAIEKFLKDNYNIRGTYTIENGIVNVDGNINVTNYDLEHLTGGLFKFGRINGSFRCNYANIETLEGAPEYVETGFYCVECPRLKSLKYSPKIVNGCFSCSFCNLLETLEGAPESVGDFMCTNCENLVNLIGAPRNVKNNFSCMCCYNLNSLEGAPNFIGGKFDYSECF